MEQKVTNNKISVYISEDDVITYEGNYYLFKEDYNKEGCVHFKNSDNGKHLRIYNVPVIVEEI